MSKFNIIYDTREKAPWDFGLYSECESSIRQGLKEGDYTLKELLDLEETTGRKILRIERKASTGEIAANLGKNWDIFIYEMERLKVYEYKMIILEFSIDTLMKFPEGSGIPERQWFRKNSEGRTVKAIKMNGPFMYGRIRDIEERFGIPVKFTSGKAEAMDIAMEVFKEVFNANQKEIQGQ